MGNTGKTVGTVGGAVVGSYFGPAGTVVGGALGGAIGSAFDGGGGNPQIQNVHVHRSGYGAGLGYTGYGQRPGVVQSGPNAGQPLAPGATPIGSPFAGSFDASDAGGVSRVNLGDVANNDAASGAEAQRVLAEAQARSSAALGLGATNMDNAQANANTFQNQGDVAAGRMLGFGDQAQGRSNALMERGAGDYAAQQSARASALNSANALQNFAANGPGPSAAQAQLQQGQDANMAQSIALAHSGRGAGDNGMAMRNAMFSNAASGQQMNQQAAALRGQESAAWNQTQLGAMNAAQGGYGNIRSGDLNALGQNTGAAQGYAGLAQGYQNGAVAAQGQAGQLMNQSLGQGMQSQLGYSTLGDTAAFQGEGLRNQILGQQMQNDQTYDLAQASQDLTSQQTNAGTTVGMAGVNQKQDAANSAMYGSAVASAANMMGSGAHNGTGGGSGYGDAGPDGYTSDVRAKKDISPRSFDDYVSSLDNGYAKQSRDTGPAYDFRPAQGYSYNYKDPQAVGAGPGMHYGPMAQDLEKTPIGASVVQAGPDGTKKVDTQRLTMANTAALAEQQRRMDQIDELLRMGQGRQMQDTGPRYGMGGR